MKETVSEAFTDGPLKWEKYKLTKLSFFSGGVSVLDP